MKNEIIAKRMNELNQALILSIDAETNGLQGQAFAIAAISYNADGEEVSRFIARCPIEGAISEWVEKNALPKMKDIQLTHVNYREMLKDFITYVYPLYKKEAVVLCHMGHVVEAKLFHDAYKFGFLGELDTPYEWLDVCLFFGCSVDSYNQEHNIKLPECEGGTHNPIYDCISAYRAFKHFVSE